MERAELEQWKGREVARLLALVENERRYYQDIVATIPVGLLVLARDLSIVSSNRAIRRIFNLRSGEPVRGRLDVMLPEWVLDKIQIVFEGGGPVQNLIVDHVGKHLRVSAMPIRNGDEENQYEALISIEDLTGEELVVHAAPPAPTAVEAPVTETAVEPEAPAPVEEPVTSAAPEPEPVAKIEPKPEPAAAEAVELLQSLDAIIWAVDIPSMQFLFVTNTAEEVLGYHPDYWLNNADFWSERIDAADRSAVLDSYHEAIEHGRRHSCEFRAKSADGRTLWLRETSRILTGPDGQPKHLIGLTIDITERRRLEDEHVRAERMEAIAKLCSRLSHDLNNMLMIINGYGEELLDHVAKTDPVRADIQEILTATERITALTNHLLAFTRRLAGPATTIDLSDLLGAAADKFKKSAGPKVAIEIQPDPGLQGTANREQLEEFLTALALRAGAIMEGGKLSIAAGETEIKEDLRRDERVIAPGTYAVISIQDTGGLVDRNEQTTLFESFLPVHELPGETGAIISRGYTFVRQWGGDIFVEPTAAGTKISVLLPYAGRIEPVVAPAPAPVEAPKPVEEPPAAVPVEEPKMETILVVEDEAGIRALVRKILKRQGYGVLEAGSGEEAIKLCQERHEKIDLLITDIMMPKMDGRELADKIREVCGDMKVLYVSGYTDDPGIYAGDFPSGTAFLQKPFTLGSLLEKVKEVLAQ